MKYSQCFLFFDYKLAGNDKTALQTRKETETEVTKKTNLTDWGYTVSSEKGKISDINKNSFIYIAPKDERDDTIKIQL